MKKLITLAVLGLAVTACDPFSDEPGGTPTVKYVTATGGGYGPFEATAGATAWTVDVQESNVTASSGRMVVITTNQLLDGSSIEAAPYDAVSGETGCRPANNWLNVTLVPGTGALPRGTLYTCYYPSSATSADGGSVVIYYSTTPPSAATAAAPTRAGQAQPADLQFRGTVQTKSGQDLPIAVDVSYGYTRIQPFPEISAETLAAPNPDAETPGVTRDPRLYALAGSVINLSQLGGGNRDTATTAWELSAGADSNGGSVAAAGRGTLSVATGAAPTYTAPATLPTAGTGEDPIEFIDVTIRGTNRRAIGTRVVRVSTGTLQVLPVPAAGSNRLTAALSSATTLSQSLTGAFVANNAKWSITAVDSNGTAVPAAGRGTISAATGATTVYTAPAALPAAAAGKPAVTYMDVTVRANQGINVTAASSPRIIRVQ